MTFAGVDGCHAGWFGVLLSDSADWTVEKFPDISCLWEKYCRASLVLLDVPIGLRDRGRRERTCDLEARKLLKGRRASSVFPAPCRGALFAEPYEKACQINKQATGRRLSVQTWSIASKIRQVDTFLSRNALARERIREVHPEVCFWALAGRPMKHSKKSMLGFRERMRVLQSAFPQTGKLVDFALSTYPRRDVARDDVLDALAAAVTAIGGLKGLMSIPKEPEFDSRGLRMQIMFRPDHHL